MNSVEALNPNSGSRLFPSETIPVDRYCATKSLSARAGVAVNAALPCWVGWPATSTLSLMTVGTPANTPSWGRPDSVRARSKSGNASPHSKGSTDSARAIAASVTSRTETSLDAIRSAIPVASRSPSASSRKAWTAESLRGVLLSVTDQGYWTHGQLGRIPEW
jgi:hypothetical protein